MRELHDNVSMTTASIKCCTDLSAAHTHQAMGDYGTRKEYSNHKDYPPQDIPGSIPAARCAHPL